jgi:hypothetical protein
VNRCNPLALSEAAAFKAFFCAQGLKLLVNLEPAPSAVKATATKKNKDDEDDQKRGGIHGNSPSRTQTEPA